MPKRKFGYTSSEKIQNVPSYARITINELKLKRAFQPLWMSYHFTICLEAKHKTITLLSLLLSKTFGNFHKLNISIFDQTVQLFREARGIYYIHKTSDVKTSFWLKRNFAFTHTYLNIINHLFLQKRHSIDKFRLQRYR